MVNRHILVLNRWDDDFAQYHRYIDHQAHRVTYLTTPAGRQPLRADLANAIYAVDSLDDAATVLKSGRTIVAQEGRVNQILALSEFDLERAAQLREDLGVPGATVERVARFRNKVQMKRQLQRWNLRIPAFVDCQDRPALGAFLRTATYPLILKPKAGAASQGVFKVGSEAEVETALARVESEEYECEEYVPGSILHVDGLVNAGALHFVKASRYINTCLDFAHGIPLGSVIIDEPRLIQRVQTYTEAVLRALGLASGAFHLELILREPDQELVFLEIGARVGGGEIAFLMRDLYGIDLVGDWVRIELGQSLSARPLGDPEVGGFLMVPEPRSVPCRVVRRTSLVGHVPGLYREILPEVGQVLDGNGGYDHIGGRFRFRGSSSAEVERAVQQAMRLYALECEPCAPTG